MTVFTLAFVGPDAAWMYACSCCSVQCSGTGWVAWQPMLERLSSCKMQRVRIVASSVEVHCSRCRRQGWQDMLCGSTRAGACWHLHYMTGLEKYSRPILRDQVQDQDRQKKRSRVVSRPRPRSRGLHHWIERSRIRLPLLHLPGSLGQLSLPSFRVGKSSSSLLAGVKAGRVHLCRVASNTVWSHIWQVTFRKHVRLCEPAIRYARIFNLYILESAAQPVCESEVNMISEMCSHCAYSD